ncbi:hypothetical protein HDU96_008653 [Phlyctochytrium bullatum]|nr:hypothetical protein HDU96_008653 [Phlyctochytrium bullatum]
MTSTQEASLEVEVKIRLASFQDLEKALAAIQADGGNAPLLSSVLQTDVFLDGPHKPLEHDNLTVFRVRRKRKTRDDGTLDADASEACALTIKSNTVIKDGVGYAMEQEASVPPTIGNAILTNPTTPDAWRSLHPLLETLCDRYGISNPSGGLVTVGTYETWRRCLRMSIGEGRDLVVEVDRTKLSIRENATFENHAPLTRHFPTFPSTQYEFGEAYEIEIETTDPVAAGTKM